MKKATLTSCILLGAIFLAGCGQKPVSQITPTTPVPPVQQPVNNTAPESDKYYSYCKPDEDPEFKLTKEDDLYYYYSGNKSIRGVVYQQNTESSITFGQRCKFELTKNYVSSIDTVKKDFNIDDAWKNKPNCDRKDGDGFLEGVYIIQVKGFKVPKLYIQQYEPNHMRDKIYMSQFSFYVDYDKIEKIEEKSQVKCPIVLY